VAATLNTMDEDTNNFQYTVFKSHNYFCQKKNTHKLLKTEDLFITDTQNVPTL